MVSALELQRALEVDMNGAAMPGLAERVPHIPHGAVLCRPGSDYLNPLVKYNPRSDWGGEARQGRRGPIWPASQASVALLEKGQKSTELP